ncbi:MAG TPA: YidC/Oxa1 family membrane protein insertase [Flexilinea sp.]|nr:YidC/Oxa1 family membrane protein insertase [Flexilinea sp.]HPS47583.1 YidC/Oxa1 family membrane protein insertase [Flexilinea sp.]
MWQSFVNIFLNILLYIYKLVGNFGVAIVLFTVLIKLITYPLMRKQIQSSTKMMELQKSPEYLEMMEKYKGNQEKLAEEQMKLYKKFGVNPTASCLPTLIQLPIIFALYQAIIAAIVSTPLGMLDLTKRAFSGFLQIGEIFPINPNFLWMNLGQPERLYIQGISFGIPVLAILVVITTIMQTKLTVPPTNPNDKNAASGAMMTGMMNIYMPLLMGFMAYTLASGLSLYFLISNVFTIVQYGVEGKLNWKALKFGKPQLPKLATPAEKPVTTSRSVPNANPKKSMTPNLAESGVDPAEEKIDYREFKNKKKPKKK